MLQWRILHKLDKGDAIYILWQLKLILIDQMLSVGTLASFFHPFADETIHVYSFAQDWEFFIYLCFWFIWRLLRLLFVVFPWEFWSLYTCASNGGTFKRYSLFESQEFLLVLCLLRWIFFEVLKQNLFLEIFKITLLNFMNFLDNMFSI